VAQHGNDVRPHFGRDNGRRGGLPHPETEGDTHERCHQGILEGKGHALRDTHPEQHRLPQHRGMPHPHPGTKTEEPHGGGVRQLRLGWRRRQGMLRNLHEDGA